MNPTLSQKFALLSLSLAILSLGTSSIAHAKSNYFVRADRPSTVLEIQDEIEDSSGKIRVDSKGNNVKAARTFNWDGISGIESPLSIVKTDKTGAVSRFEDNSGDLFFKFVDGGKLRVAENEDALSMGMDLVPASDSEVKAAKGELQTTADAAARLLRSHVVATFNGTAPADDLEGTYALTFTGSIFEQQRHIGDEIKKIEIKSGEKGKLFATLAQWNGKEEATAPKEIKIIGHQMMIEVSSQEYVYLTPSANGLIFQQGNANQTVLDSKTGKVYNLASLSESEGTFVKTSEVIAPRDTDNFIAKFLKKRKSK